MTLRIGRNRIQTAQVDADNVPELVKLIKSFSPDIVVNVSRIRIFILWVDARLETGVAYSTPNYEPLETKFEYSWQWGYAGKV